MIYLYIAALYMTALIFPVSSALGQAAPERLAEVPPTIRSTSTLVIVPTLVRSQTGELIEMLHANDFRLTDNGVEQRISIEDVERQPLAVVVLMQTGGAASRQFANYAKVGTLLDYMMGSAAHRVALVTFDSRPEDLWSFTSQIEELADGFSHPEPGDGGASIYDAVDYGVDLLKQQPANFRRILILFSQTHDDGSKTQADAVIRHLGENNVTIYSVTFSPEKAWLKDQFAKPRHGNAPYQLSKVPGDAPVINTFNLSEPLGIAIRAMRANAASEIATLSGGEYVEFGGKRDLERQLAVLANHIPNRYMLSFHPTSNQTGFHSLQVEISGRPGLQVSARTSYWSAESPAKGSFW